MPSTNGKNQLHVMRWQPEGEVKAIVQISHGMIEHIGRYDDFARFLAKENILVVGNDHLGHGQSVKSKEEFGYFDAEDMSQTVVNDLYEVTKSIKQEYPDIPYFLLGHSMGSFMARRYLMTYGKVLNGAIIMGTGHQPQCALVAGKIAYYILKALKGDTYRSQFVNGLTLESYNQKFKPNRTACDWLSRSEAAVDAYIKEPYCDFKFTINGFKTIFDTFTYINKKSHIAKIPTELPILLVAGEKDPVGNMGKGVKTVYKHYESSGISDIRLKLYPESRHELLNEINYKEVYEDLYNWLKEHM